MRSLSSVIKANHVTVGEKMLISEAVFGEMQALSVAIDDLQDQQNQLLEESKREAEKLKEEAEQVLRDALNQAERIREEARSEILIKREEALEQARSDGYSKGVAEAEAAMNQMYLDANQHLEQAKQEAQQAMNDVEPHMVQILKGLVEKVLCTSMRYDDEIILHMIRKGFAEQKISGLVKIRVNLQQAPFVMEHKDMLQKGLSSDIHLEVIEDHELDFGGCIVETGAGHIVLNLGDQIESIKEYLDLLASDL